MPRLINTELLGNPYNWLPVCGIIVLTWMAILVVFSHSQAGPTTPDDIAKGNV